MTASIVIPGVIVAPGSPGDGSAGYTAPGQVAISLQNLLSQAADIISGSGAKTVILTAGDIGMASPFQVGFSETSQQQQANLQALRSFAAECRADGVGVVVDAELTNPALFGDGSNALTQYWAPEAAEVGLPIVGVENVDETGFNVSGAALTSYAGVEANAVKTLIQDYTNSSYSLTANSLKVGDMDCGSVTNEAAWINVYDAAARAVGVPTFSFFTYDMGLFEPWMISSSSWAADMESFSTLAAQDGLAFDPIVQGVFTDLSAGQFVAQAEQMAVDSAKLQSAGLVNIGSLVATSWRAQPVGVNEISSPTSTANEAAEIKAVYPLYLSNSITATGTITTSAPGQILLNTGSVASIEPLIITWDTVDVNHGLRLGVVLIDQTGALTATQHGAGTVLNPASNILVLTGDAADLAFELGSVELEEPYAGPDTLDVETYGYYGRIADNQVAIYAAPGPTVGALNATSSAQGWSASRAVLNTGTVVGSGSLVTTETLYWGATITPSGVSATAQTGFLQVDSIHEPLAEYGVEFASASLLGTASGGIADVFDPSIDSPSYGTPGYANNPGVNNLAVGTPLSGGYQGNAFAPMSALTALIVLSTVRTFDPVTGQLETSVDTLAPDPVTVIDLTGSHADAFATAFDQGGTQVTVLNTANNPLWQMGWGTQFSSATLTYDGSGRLVEEFLKGSPNNPLFTIDNVYDPSNGQLWEQFQSSAQPPEAASSATYASTGTPYQADYATGPVYVLQIDTGDNPNWDYVDWGIIPTNTTMWTDYFATDDIAGMVVNALAGQSNGVSDYPLQFVNGSTLDLIALPGSIAVNLNALGSVTIQSQTMVSSLSGLSSIDAWGGTGPVSLTGLAGGGSTLTGGDDNSTIVGFGNDTIIAGAGVTTIATGAGGSHIFVTSVNGTTTLTGSNDTVTAAAGSSITILGTNDTVVLTGAPGALNIAPGDVVQLYETLAWSGYGSITPFAHIAIGSANTGVAEIVTVTLASSADDTLSNLGIGSYDPVTRTYSVVGTGVAVTAALNGLLFTPTPGSTASAGTATTSAVIATNVVVPPTINGTQAGQTTTDEAAIAPFGAVVIADANIGQIETVTVTLSAAANGTLTNLGSGSYSASNGLYTVSGTVGMVNAALKGLMFTPKLDRTAPGGSVATGFTIQDRDTAGASATNTTTTVIATAAPLMAFIVTDNVTGARIDSAGVSYTGPQAGLAFQYVSPTQNSVNINTTQPNAFIVTGSGNDGINTSGGGGNNVIDAEGGSNFIVGGRGDNTVFLDNRDLTADIWTSITDFHAGDAVTLYGLTPTQMYSWWNGLGAAGYQGLTMLMQQPGQPNVSLTLTGYTNADLTNGKLSLVYGGQETANPYLYIHGE